MKSIVTNSRGMGKTGRFKITLSTRGRTALQRNVPTHSKTNDHDEPLRITKINTEL